MNVKKEFAELVREVREQASMLHEFGVESLRVDTFFLDKPGEAGTALPHPPDHLEVERPRVIEVPIPPADIAPKPVEPPPRRSAGSRLSSLPSLSHRAKPEAPIVQHTIEHGGHDMPEPKHGPAPAHTLFGDIAKTLPEPGETIDEIRVDIGNCTRCPLHQGRTKIVHTVGNLHADLMFVGEAPGADEDTQGEPFVGRAGQLLNKIIESIGLRREEVCIGNINRCRPPGNRQPTLPEAHACKPFLLREIAAIRPKVIVVLGNTAMHNLLDTKVGITRMRGHFHDYFGVKVMPTFHPAYLLRDPAKKREVWEDMKKVREYLNGQGSSNAGFAF